MDDRMFFPMVQSQNAEQRQFIEAIAWRFAAMLP